ncbi:hypothetical protein ACEQ8H_005686 [Pleosporales sp. CAS-2024a]
MAVDANAVAECVLATFDLLPDKRKPRPRHDGSKEWVPLAGIVLSKASPWIRKRCQDERLDNEAQLFTIREDVHIHMYCSEAPCGDASMELVMDAQEDATPWTSAPRTVATMVSESMESAEEYPEALALRGRSHFAHLGVVRCKPSRSDAPPTLSKSCTDKLALKQATSLLSSVTSTLISPRNAYLDTLILPRSQYVPAACERAFSPTGRLKNVFSASWTGGYTWWPFDVKVTDGEFKWSRRTMAPTDKAMPSNVSAVYTPAWQETVIGGVVQGRKQLDPRGASAICRRSMWKTAVQVAGLAGVPKLHQVLCKTSYQDMKQDEALAARRKVKDDMKADVLQGWVSNAGDDEFSIG